MKRWSSLTVIAALSASAACTHDALAPRPEAPHEGARHSTLLDPAAEAIRVPSVSLADYYHAPADGAADATDSIQKAVYAGRDVYVPAGTYRITRSINLPSNTRVHGAGAASVIRRTPRGPTRSSP